MANHPNRGRNKGPSANPTPEQIKAARLNAGLTQTEAARLVHATLRAWQSWEAPEGQESSIAGAILARRMHPGLWELFNIKIGKLRKGE